MTGCLHGTKGGKGRVRCASTMRDDRYPGTYTGRHEYLVDAAAVARYIAATAESHPWYTGASPFGGPVAPALILHGEPYAFPARDWYLDPVEGNLQARQEWELFRPIPVGTTIWTHGMIVDRRTGATRDTVVLEVLVFDEADVLLARTRCHQSFVRPGAPPADREQAARAAAPDGPWVEELPPLRRVATIDHCRAFSGPRPTYHTDAAAAGEMGFAGVVVQGTYSLVLLSELLTARFGEGWYCGGRLDARFRSVLWAGEAVTARAAIRAIEPAGSRFCATLDAWCEKDDGTITVSATARALFAPVPPFGEATHQ